MQFQEEYLQAMQSQAPAYLSQLSESGQLQSHLDLKFREAQALWQNLTSVDQRDSSGCLIEPNRTLEVEDQIRSQLFVFPT